jgi:hypothetical protein
MRITMHCSPGTRPLPSSIGQVVVGDVARWPSHPAVHSLYCIDMIEWTDFCGCISLSSSDLLDGTESGSFRSNNTQTAKL